MKELINYDQQLFLFLNGLGTETWDGFWMFITDKLSSIPLYAVLLFVAFKKLGLKSTLLLLIFIALMIAASDQLSNAFKYGFERLRPCKDETIFAQMRLVKPSCGGRFGYFSAHASNSFAVATFFTLLLKQSNKWWPAFLLIWALTVAYSRIYIGVHYPLDVITGMSFGMLFGWGFSRLFSLVSRRLIKV